MPRIVGNNANGYPDIRNINEVPFERYEFRRVRDWVNYANYAWFKVLRRNNQFLLNMHWRPGRHKVDILHFFNRLSATKQPYVTTYETSLPRWNERSAYGMRLMARPNCKQLIALSKAADRIQRMNLADFAFQRNKVEAKLTVLMPPQKILTETYEPREGKRLEVALVGHAIFRKGGRESVAAVRRLVQEGYDIRLTLVSALQPDSYATKTGASDVREIKRDIAAAGAAVRHIPSADNSEVLSILMQSHVSLLPSFAETFGYAVLEAQAAGCPVITTDVRAFPEINNDECGWVIPIPKTVRGDARLHSARHRAAAAADLEAGIYEALKAAHDDLEMVASKGRAAIERIRAEHDPVAHARRLEEIYDEALKGE